MPASDLAQHRAFDGHVPVELADLRVRYVTFRDMPAADRDGAAAAWRSSIAADESLVVETCHRVELLTVRDVPEGDPTRGSPTGAAELCGRDAVRRAFEVVAGFDSAVVAEEQLLGQARLAHADALTRGTAGPVLDQLMRRAVRFGRRVRTHATPGTDRSLADRGAQWLIERVPPSARVAIVGTGEMGRLIATRLRDAGLALVVVSRSAERGAAMVRDALDGAAELRIGAVDRELVGRLDGLVIALRARAPSLGSQEVSGGAVPWVLDVSTPGGVTAEAAAVLGERLLDVDALAELTGSAPALRPSVEARLREELEREVDQFVEWLQARRASDAVGVLRREADDVRRRHIARLARRAGLDAAQLAAVDAAAAAMLGELLHGPTMAVKRGGVDARSVRRLFGIEA